LSTNDHKGAKIAIAGGITAIGVLLMASFQSGRTMDGAARDERSRSADAKTVWAKAAGDPTARNGSGDLVWYGMDLTKPLDAHTAGYLEERDTSSVDGTGIRAGRLPAPVGEDAERRLRPVAGWDTVYASSARKGGTASIPKGIVSFNLVNGDRRTADAMFERTRDELVERFDLSNEDLVARDPKRPEARYVLLKLDDRSNRRGPRSEDLKGVMLSQDSDRVSLIIVPTRRFGAMDAVKSAR
jgi:hypothetical protein